MDGADADLPNVLTPEQIMAGKPMPGSTAVVLDGDGRFTGIAMAELLADQGKQVTLVTNMHDVVQYSLYTMEMANNKRLLYQKGIKTYTNHWGQDYRNNILTMFYLYRDSAALTENEPGKWGRTRSSAVVRLDCDALVLVTTRVPNCQLYDGLKARRDEWPACEIEDVYRIGDCHAPRHITNAIFDGHRLAREFDSPHPQYPLPFIRERPDFGSRDLSEARETRARTVEVVVAREHFPGWLKQANVCHHSSARLSCEQRPAGGGSPALGQDVVRTRDPHPLQPTIPPHPPALAAHSAPSYEGGTSILARRDGVARPGTKDASRVNFWRWNMRGSTRAAGLVSGGAHARSKAGARARAEVGRRTGSKYL